MFSSIPTATEINIEYENVNTEHIPYAIAVKTEIKPNEFSLRSKNLLKTFELTKTSNMSVPKIRIRKFNPEILETRRLHGSPPTIVVIGKRGSGKSTLIADLMWHMRRIPMFICMSGTEEGNGFYKKHMHPLLIHGEYKKDIVSNLIKQQKDKLKKCIKAGIDPNTRPDLGTGLLLDDCGFNKRLFYQEDMRLLFMNGRHWKICFITSLQYMMGIPPDLRTNIDFVFCLRENIVANQKRLYDNFFGCFKKFSHFQEAFNACTENYECLVLDNTSKSTKVENCVFYYKATPDREYKLGSRDLWAYLNSRYKEDDEDEEEETDRMQSSIVIKKAPMVRIVEKEY